MKEAIHESLTLIGPKTLPCTQMHSCSSPSMKWHNILYNLETSPCTLSHLQLAHTVQMLYRASTSYPLGGGGKEKSLHAQQTEYFTEYFCSKFVEPTHARPVTKRDNYVLPFT